MKAVKKGKKPEGNQPEPTENGIKEAGVFAVVKNGLVLLEVRGDKGGIIVGLTVEQCNAVAMILTTLADELASKLSPVEVVE